MNELLAKLPKEQLTNLIKLFDVQIAIVIVIIAFLTKSVFAKLVINIVNKILKRKSDPKDSSMYNTIKWMYVFVRNIFSGRNFTNNRKFFSNNENTI